MKNESSLRGLVQRIHGLICRPYSTAFAGVLTIVFGRDRVEWRNVTRPDDPSSFETAPIRGAGFFFRSGNTRFSGRKWHGPVRDDFDSMGRRYVCSNSRHVLWVAYERNQVRLNPYYELPDPLVSIPQDGAAPVFRISYDEPWRVVRTRWRCFWCG